MIHQTTLKELLSDLEFIDPKHRKKQGERSGITLWLTPDLKQRYDLLQLGSGGKFSKKLRQAVLALIEAAESKQKGGEISSG